MIFHSPRHDRLTAAQQKHTRWGALCVLSQAAALFAFCLFIVSMEPLAGLACWLVMAVALWANHHTAEAGDELRQLEREWRL